MTIAYVCLVVMMFIPLVCAGYAKFSVKGYDNRSPREFLKRVEGAAKRADYAQMNTFENFPYFAAAVIVAHQLQAPQAVVDTLAMGFVFARVLYAVFYIVDQHLLRSLCYVAGFVLTILLFFAGV